MAWITPKTDWTTADGVDYTDLNRIEGNLVALQTGTKEHVLLTSTGETILARDGGNVLIGTTTDAGERVHIGSGGMRVTGTSGVVVLNANGIQMDFSGTSANYIRATGTGGYLAFNTDGTSGTANANVLFNADQSTTFNSNVKIAGSRVSFTGAGLNGISNFSATGYVGVWTANRSSTEANANVIFNADQSVTVNTSLLVDTISEKTGAAGVTIDGLLIKDSGIGASFAVQGSLTATTSVLTNTINERTPSAGVTIDSVLLRDNTVTATTLSANTSVITDTISEKTASAGVTIGSVLKLKHHYSIYGMTDRNEIYTLFSSVVPNVGDKMHFDFGYWKTGSDVYKLIGLHRDSTTTIKMNCITISAAGAYFSNAPLSATSFPLAGDLVAEVSELTV